jgi:hypothetical protein
MIGYACFKYFRIYLKMWDGGVQVDLEAKSKFASGENFYEYIITSSLYSYPIHFKLIILK